MISLDESYNLFEIIQKADAGDLEAMSVAVSIIEMEGYLEKDSDEEIRERYVSYLLNMAQNGMKEAYILLGDAYRKGCGVEKNPQEAIIWYTKAAVSGENFGNESIGMMYYEGIDIETDYEKAFTYFTKDEGKKSFCTIYSLGEMYRLGFYVGINYVKSCEYYSEIVYSELRYAELDDYHWRACYRLAYNLHYGLGIEKNLNEALLLLSKANNNINSNDFIIGKGEVTQEEFWNEWVLLNQDIEAAKDYH